ncbi:hypothetical protein DAD99_13320 [Pseudarthrobacter sp. AB1]|nr:hypothetical protein [Pseudarthrobacter sp. AB1]
MLAADGMPNIQIEKITGVSAPTVLKWRNRYAEGGIEALSDVQRLGREREIDELALTADTLTNDRNPPAELGSRTGPPASWPNATESPFPPWPESGGVGKFSRTGSRRSSSPLTPPWSPSSGTWWACTCPRRKTRWW